MNILIVDDHEIIKEGTNNRVSKTLPDSNCLFANNLREVTHLLNEQKIDLVLCDLEFKNDSNITGFIIAENILKFEPRVKLVAHTNYNSYRVMNKAIKCGFQSFMYKGASLTEFKNVIINVLKSNEVYESETMEELRKKRKQFLRTIFSDSLYGISSLSQREIDLVLLTKKTNNRQELSEIMNVQPSTIDTYFKRIIDKLALKDRKEIAMFSYEFYDEIVKQSC